MCDMGESSLPPFKWSKLYRPPIARFKGSLRRFLSRRAIRSPQPKPPIATTEVYPSQDTDTGNLDARNAVRGFLEEQAASVDRALRLTQQVERLEGEGTPSESVRNRAERACQEVVSGLAALRSEFVAARKNEPGVARDFDLEVERAYPAFKPSDDSFS